MTMIPEYRICPFCGKTYSWNPDVGKFYCPKCGMPFWGGEPKKEEPWWKKMGK